MPSLPVTTADVTGVSMSVFAVRLSELRVIGTPRIVPGLLPAPAPGESLSVSSPRNCRHPWTTWPEKAPASKATPIRYSVSLSSRSWSSRKSSCPTWYVVRPGPA